MTNKTITLNLWKDNNVDAMAIQGEVDSRFLKIKLIDDDGPLNLTNKTVQFLAKKPDGTVVYNNLTVEDAENGIAGLSLTSQLTAVAGILQDCEIHIISGNGDTLKVKKINILVKESLGQAVEESISEITAYQEIINNINSLNQHISNKSNPHEVTAEQIGATTLTTATTSENGLMSSNDKSKLDGIASGAEVNVQSDWNQTTSSADDFIKNKPTNVSVFTNDAGYLTTETDPTVPSWAKASSKPSYSYSEISNTPTNVSTFTNDAGYLTTETDPTVPSWAKASSKPSYSYSEISNTPTNISTFTNDVGYLTTETDPTVPSWAKASSKPSYSYSEISNTPTNISTFTNDAGYLTTETDPTVPSWAKASSKPSYSYSEISNTPTKLSEFTNDAGYISDSLPSLWYVLTSGINKSPTSMCCGNSLYVVVCTSGGIYTSTDGFYWTSRTSNVTTVLRSIVYSGTQFVVVGNSGTIVTSDDGITWTVQTSNTSVNLYSINYGNNKYVAVGDSGTVLTSSDGINWASTTAGSRVLRTVCYGNGMFVIVGHNGVLYTSSDTTTWTPRSSNTSKNLIGVCYGNNKFVACGASGITTYSADGVTWTSNQTAIAFDLNSICYGDEFKIAGSGTSILSSQDGINWQSETNPYTSGTFNCIIYNDSKYYAAYDATSKNILVKMNKLSDILKYISSKM